MLIRRLQAGMFDRAMFEGGGKGGSVETIATEPAPAPPSEEASLQEFQDEDINKSKKTAKTQGAKSLQIPLVGDATGDTKTTGTV